MCEEILYLATGIAVAYTAAPKVVCCKGLFSPFFPVKAWTGDDGFHRLTHLYETFEWCNSHHLTCLIAACYRQGGKQDLPFFLLVLIIRLYLG